MLAMVVLLTACNPGAGEARGLAASCSGGDATACNELGHRVAQGDRVLIAGRCAKYMDAIAYVPDRF